MANYTYGYFGCSLRNYGFRIANKKVKLWWMRESQFVTIYYIY